MSDLIPRLLEAIEAKEEKARAALNGVNVFMHVGGGPVGANWTAFGGLVSDDRGTPLWDCEGSETLCMADEVAEHVADNDPSSVLRRCEADREILAMYDERFSDDYIWKPILKALGKAYGLTEEET
jgi:uncharacterized protein DUF6221